MRIDSSGNVGIGTTSPSRLLTLSGSGATLLSLVSTDDDNCQVLFGDSASDAVGKVVYAHDTNHMRFEVNAAERMRIDSSGNVGIGTTATTNARLNVQADGNNVSTFFTNIDGTYNPYLQTFHEGVSGTRVLNSSSYGGNAGNYTQDVAANYIVKTGGSERMRIDSSGNVGIGTTSPSNLAHIASSGGSTVLELQRTNTNTIGAVGAISFTALDGHSVAGIVARGDGDNEGAHLTFNTTSAASANDVYSSTTERMRIDSSGNVGIGATPVTGNRLRLSGGMLLLDNGIEIRSYDTGSSQRTIARVNTSNELEYGWSGSGPVKFMGGGSYTERMRIHTDGSVGIGTSSPTSHLDVSGDINYTGNLKKNGVVIPSTGMEYIDYVNVSATSQTGYINLSSSLWIAPESPHKFFVYIDGTGSAGNNIKLAFNYAGFGTRWLTGWCKYTNLSGTDTFVAKTSYNANYTTEYMTMGTSRSNVNDGTHIEIDVTSHRYNTMAFSGKFCHSVDPGGGVSTFEKGDFGYQSGHGSYGNRISRVYYDLGSTPSSAADIRIYVWGYIT